MEREEVKKICKCSTCEGSGWEGCPSYDLGEELGDVNAKIRESGLATGYDASIVELRKLLKDCVKNRDEEDPELQDEGWKGFIQGVENAIYRLEMHSAS